MKSYCPQNEAVWMNRKLKSVNDQKKTKKNQIFKLGLETLAKPDWKVFLCCYAQCLLDYSHLAHISCRVILLHVMIQCQNIPFHFIRCNFWFCFFFFFCMILYVICCVFFWWKDTHTCECTETKSNQPNQHY